MLHTPFGIYSANKTVPEAVVFTTDPAEYRLVINILRDILTYKNNNVMIDGAIMQFDNSNNYFTLDYYIQIPKQELPVPGIRVNAQDCNATVINTLLICITRSFCERYNDFLQGKNYAQHKELAQRETNNYDQFFNEIFSYETYEQKYNAIETNSPDYADTNNTWSNLVSEQQKNINKLSY